MVRCVDALPAAGRSAGARAPVNGRAEQCRQQGERLMQRERHRERLQRGDGRGDDGARGEAGRGFPAPSERRRSLSEFIKEPIRQTRVRQDRRSVWIKEVVSDPRVLDKRNQAARRFAFRLAQPKPNSIRRALIARGDRRVIDRQGWPQGRRRSLVALQLQDLTAVGR